MKSVAKPLPKVIVAEYQSEARQAGSVPASTGLSVAIGGRSNVGKSTLLNALCARISLARTSKTPGRTRGVIFYNLVLEPPVTHSTESAARWPMRFADLPGYGYAKVAKTERQSWGPLVEGYILGDSGLKLVLVLVDCRRGMQEEEAQLLSWLRDEGVPSRIVLTKVDKISASERGLLKAQISQQIGVKKAPISLVSAHSGEGIDKLWDLILKAVRPEVEAAFAP